jgi:hypothetical protein
MTLLQVETYLNQALNALAEVPQIPAPYSTNIAAAMVIVPRIEAFVNAHISTNRAALAPRAKALTPTGMTIEQVWAVLRNPAHRRIGSATRSPPHSASGEHPTAARPTWCSPSALGLGTPRRSVSPLVDKI